MSEETCQQCDAPIEGDDAGRCQFCHRLFCAACLPAYEHLGNCSDVFIDPDEF